VKVAIAALPIPGVLAEAGHHFGRGEKLAESFGSLH
jgi:hypothetical protein